eukprot:TRINITY_DN12538_c0_g1_i2.p1 TRINITY_DN12538_c0_g1~~TRINITY_DN12538_c0_g1_i2.p1  ORF type:complete len:348 (+),score=62.60 TRINITY_DN12538_c0_g1_i2:275-1318(+)
MAIGLNDGTAETMDVDKLDISEVFTYGAKTGSKYPAVTAINCRIKERVIAGYENGSINEFSVRSPLQPLTSIPPAKSESLEFCFPVAHVECSEKRKAIVAVYNMGKEASVIVSYESGSSTASYIINHPSGSIICMRLLEWAQSMVTLSNFKNEIIIYDYTDGSQLVSLQAQIPNITFHNPITAFTLLPLTKQIRLKYANSLREEPKGDLLVLGMVDGTILTAYLSLSFDKSKVMASVVPQQLYRSKSTDMYELCITSLYVDEVTDNIVAGDIQGNIFVLDKPIVQILNPDRAKQSAELNLLTKTSDNSKENNSATLGSEPEPIGFEMVERKSKDCWILLFHPPHIFE